MDADKFLGLRRWFIRREMVTLSLALLLLPALLTACSIVSAADATHTPGGPNVKFVVHVQATAQNKIWVEYGLENRGEELPADDRFAGRLTLTGPQGLRAAVDVHDLPPLAGGQYAPMGSWESVLAPGNYRIVWGAPGYGTAQLDFRLRFRAGQAVIEEH